MLVGGFGSIIIGATHDLPASGHGGASGFIADGEASDPIDFLDDLEHAMQETVLFDNCTWSMSKQGRDGYRRGHQKTYSDEPTILPAQRSWDRHTRSRSYPSHSRGHISPGRSTWEHRDHKGEGCPCSRSATGSWVRHPPGAFEQLEKEPDFHCSSSGRYCCCSCCYCLCRILGG